MKGKNTYLLIVPSGVTKEIKCDNVQILENGRILFVNYESNNREKEIIASGSAQCSFVIKP